MNNNNKRMLKKGKKDKEIKMFLKIKKVIKQIPIYQQEITNMKKLKCYTERQFQNLSVEIKECLKMLQFQFKNMDQVKTIH